MILVTDAFRSWSRFTWLRNATAKLSHSAKGDKILIKAYLRLVDRIPFLQWEQYITSIDEINGDLLCHLGDNALTIADWPMATFIDVPKKTYPGLCFAACWYYKKQDPSYDYYIGFCLTDDNWHLHAFLVKDGVIFEPTGIEREKYTGLKIERPDLLLHPETLILE